MAVEISTAKKFAKNVAVLMTGTTIAQAIPVLVSPILTRIYGPEAFGIFALYLAIASIVAVMITGRYELAIIIPRTYKSALHIAALAILLAGFSSICIFFVVFIFGDEIRTAFGWGDEGGWLYWLPISVFFMATYQSLNYLCNRQGRYRQMAISRVFQSTTMSAVHLAAGYLKAGATGLISGQIVGQFVSACVMAYMIFIRQPRSKLKINRKKIYVLARRYVAFPKYLIFAHGFNTASAQSPVLFLSAFFGSDSAGFYILIQRVIGAPMVIIAGAIGDVFRQEASREYAVNGNCHLIYRKAFSRLLLISILPFFVFFIIAPHLFEFFFGENWREAGNYARILTPMFFLQFVTSPLSIMYMIAQKQKLDLAWQVVLFGLIVLAFSIGAYTESIETSLILVSCFYSFMYAVNGVISYKLAQGVWR